MNEYTAGPWHVQEQVPSGVFVIEAEQYEWTVASTGQCDTREEELANARLIAAAPELLAACEKLLATYDDETLSGVEYLDSLSELLGNEVGTASAKARGEA